ncbi:MAG: DUF892 family protein [Acidobacteriota bacterium]|nr:DUF892 family protein [Acidobacteriota bacterium]
MKLTTLEDLLVLELSELYNAENQILKALPAMSKAASQPALSKAFDEHYKQTKDHVARLERIFTALKDDPWKVKSEPIGAIAAQGEELMSEKSSDSSVVDAGLIAVAQKVEHYEIAAYGCVRTHAKLLGYEKISGLLATTLKEEEDTDAKLTSIAEAVVNVQAGKAPYAQARTAPRMGEGEGGGGMGRVLFGLGVGAALALLYAPKPGEETREDLLNRANDSKEYLKRRSDELRKSAGDLLDKSRQTINEQTGKIADTVQAGKDAVKHASGGADTGNS